MRRELVDELNAVVRPEMKDMQARIVNSSYPVLGSKVGDIRKLARKYSNDLTILENLKEESYEEILLHGLILAYNKSSIINKFRLFMDYLKIVDSWALIDSFCSTFKIKNEERDELFEFLKECLNSDDEFVQRFALIMFLSHYIKYDNDKKLHRPKLVEMKDLNITRNSSWLNPILKEIDKPYSTYYAQMGVAWLLAEAFLFFPKEILQFLNSNHLDDMSFNLTIDKIRQSKNPSRELKDYIKEFKKNS